MTDFNFSTASAVGLYQSVVGFVIVMTVNYIVKKIEPDYSLFCSESEVMNHGKKTG